MRTSKKYSPKNGIAPANQEARLPTKRPEPSLWSGMVNGSSCGHRASQWTVCPLAAKHVIRSVRMVGAQRARFSGNNFSASSLFFPISVPPRSGICPYFSATVRPHSSRHLQPWRREQSTAPDHDDVQRAMAARNVYPAPRPVGRRSRWAVDSRGRSGRPRPACRRLSGRWLTQACPKRSAVCLRRV